jgi:outer membrane protein assembly factor BamE (lipoprotein component of BamABCDE complex)
MKSRFATVLFAAALAAPVLVSIGGCAMGNTSIANENEGTLSQKLVPGKTTKAQVLHEFGEPSEKAVVAGTETWRYRMVTTKFRTYVPFASLAMGNDGADMTDVVVTFDRAGRVVRHDVIKTKG